MEESGVLAGLITQSHWFKSSHRNLLLTLTALILAQADAGSTDAGISANPLTEIYGSCPEVTFSDGGVAELAFPVKRTGSFIEELSIDAGSTSDWYSPYPRPQRVSCKLAACEARVEELDSWGRSLNLPWWAALSIGIAAAAAGATVMYEVCTRVPAICGSR